MGGRGDNAPAVDPDAQRAKRPSSAMSAWRVFGLALVLLHTMVPARPLERDLLHGRHHSGLEEVAGNAGAPERSKEGSGHGAGRRGTNRRDGEDHEGPEPAEGLSV